MNVFIRTDSSVESGSGHVMRCITLAEELRVNKAKVVFICRELPGNLIGLIEDRGFRLNRLPPPDNTSKLLEGTKHANWLGVSWQTDADQTLDVMSHLPIPDWLIVDHYSLDHKWEKRVRSLVKKIMVIDDIADRQHDCDLLLDQNLYDHMESRYIALLPEHCVTLLGPHYALLRNEFLEARNSIRYRDGTIKRIIIFFGGCDRSNETKKALTAITKLNRDDLIIDVVVGENNPHKNEIDVICSNFSYIYFHCQVSDMATLMEKADLAIGAGGTTTWERCALGLPTITISVAENQIPIAQSAANAGALLYLGQAYTVDSNILVNTILQLINNKDQLTKITEKAKQLVDGLGAKRVATYLV